MRGGEAAVEFQKIPDHAGIVVNEPIELRLCRIMPARWPQNLQNWLFKVL